MVDATGHISRRNNQLCREVSKHSTPRPVVIDVQSKEYSFAVSIHQVASELAPVKHPLQWD
jgi:hypothetical protein